MLLHNTNPKLSSLGRNDSVHLNINIMQPSIKTPLKVMHQHISLIQSYHLLKANVMTTDLDQNIKLQRTEADQ